MKFHVEGASRSNGAPIKTTVQADSEETAVATSNSMGILVSKIWLDSPAKNDALAEELSRMRTEPSLKERMRGKLNPQSPGVPDYGALKFISSVLFAEAFVCYFCAAVCIVMIPVYLLNAWGNLTASVAGPISLLGTALAVAVVGGIIHGFSQACLALRDIARNSFKP